MYITPQIVSEVVAQIQQGRIERREVARNQLDSVSAGLANWIPEGYTSDIQHREDSDGDEGSEMG
jgi:hypothetical protein